MITDFAALKKRLKCCSCGESMEKSENLNTMCLMKVAKWAFPCWGNVILGVWGFASAVVCDKCIKEQKEVKFAIEWDKNQLNIKYHPIKELEDVPLRNL